MVCGATLAQHISTYLKIRTPKESRHLAHYKPACSLHFCCVQRVFGLSISAIATKPSIVTWLGSTMTQKNKILRSYLVCLTTVWLAALSFGMAEALAEEVHPLQLQKYKRQKNSITAWFRSAQPATQKKTSHKVRLAIGLNNRELIVDGVLSGTNILLATLKGKEPSIYDVRLNSKQNKAVRVEHRPPNQQDFEIFSSLGGKIGPGGSEPDTVRTMNPPSCQITIHSLPNGRCPACEILKRQYPETQTTCPQIIHVLEGGTPRNNGITYYPQVSWPAGGPKEGGMGEAQAYCQQKCKSTPPTTDPSTPPTTDPSTPPQPPKPGSGSCSNGAKADPCGYDNVCCAPLVCENPQLKKCKLPTPPPPPPTSPPAGQDPGTCYVDANGVLVCSPNTTNPSEPPVGSCKKTYSCRYADGSTGRGEITCSPGTSSVSGHWGSLDCKSCTPRWATGCGEGSTPPSGPPVNPPASGGAPCGLGGCPGAS